MANLKGLLTLFFIAAIMSSCSTGRYLVRDVKDGLIPQNVPEKTVEEFVRRRMKNRREYKVNLARQWNIIREDSTWVYWGLTSVGSKNDDAPADSSWGKLDSLYKTSKSELFLAFPFYKTLDGGRIWYMISLKMRHKSDDSLSGVNCIAEKYDRSFVYVNEVLHVEFQCFCQGTKWKNGVLSGWFGMPYHLLYQYKIDVDLKDTNDVKVKREIATD